MSTDTAPAWKSPLLSTFEAADYLGVPRQTLAVWRSRDVRQGPAYVPMGRHVKYRLADLDAFIAARRVVPQATETRHG